MNNDILTLDLTRALPPPLKNDEAIYALGRTIEAELKETIRLSRQNIIYARIDELPEALLDILAYDMHVDWYDSRYNIEAKRRIIKDSVKVHKRLGTKYAVEMALSDVFPNRSRVEEWFEYGGDPYRFRVIIDITDEEVTAEKQAITFSNIFFYKNLRSHLDGLRYHTEREARLRTGARSGTGVSVSVLPSFVRERDSQGLERVGAFTQTARRVSVQPIYTRALSAQASDRLGAFALITRRVSIKPLTIREYSGAATATTGVYTQATRRISILAAQ